MRMNHSIPSLSVPTRRLLQHDQVPLTANGQSPGCPFACAAVFVRVPKSGIICSLPIQNRGICGKGPGFGTFTLCQSWWSKRIAAVAEDTSGVLAIFDTRTDTKSRKVLWQERHFRFRSLFLPVPHNETERATRCPMSPVLVRVRKIVDELRLIPLPGKVGSSTKGCFVWNRTEKTSSHFRIQSITFADVRQPIFASWLLIYYGWDCKSFPTELYSILFPHHCRLSAPSRSTIVRTR